MGSLSLRLAKLEARVPSTVVAPDATHIVDRPTAEARHAEIQRMIEVGEAAEHDIFMCIVSPSDPDRRQETCGVERLH
jgi:hypothetical protein